jgi:Na+/H+-dicarboxylate symporter
MSDMKTIGRVGLKSLIYFEVMTTIALVIGLVAVNMMNPGAGMHIDPSTLDASAIAGYTKAAHEQTVVGFLSHIIPKTVFAAFVDGELLRSCSFPSSLRSVCRCWASAASRCFTSSMQVPRPSSIWCAS